MRAQNNLSGFYLIVGGLLGIAYAVFIARLIQGFSIIVRNNEAELEAKGVPVPLENEDEDELSPSEEKSELVPLKEKE